MEQISVYLTKSFFFVQTLYSDIDLIKVRQMSHVEIENSIIS